MMFGRMELQSDREGTRLRRMAPAMLSVFLWKRVIHLSYRNRMNHFLPIITA